MPQYLTLSIGAKVDKGPDIKSEAKVEISNYAPLCDEPVCKCTTSPVFDIPTFSKKDGLYVLITADKYYSDKDCVTPNLPRGCEPKKFLRYALTGSKIQKVEWRKLDRPVILNEAPDFEGIVFQNELTIDVKVSVLVFRMAPETCPPPGNTPNDCQGKPGNEPLPAPGQGQQVYHSVLR